MAQTLSPDKISGIVSAIPLSASQNMTVIYPSAQQMKIAPGRDFLVIGSFENVTVPVDASLYVILMQMDDSGTGTILRTIYTNTRDDADALYIEYPRLSYYGDDRTELSASDMPDLLYAAPDLNTFPNTWQKAYYDSYNFSAVVYGGTYNFDTNQTDQYGQTLEPLAEGNYQMYAFLIDSTATTILAAAQENIEIAYAQDKVLARFSPNNHFAKVQNTAQTLGYTLFLDPFPGYWSPEGFLQALADNPLFCEILPKWRLADTQEYYAGNVHFYIYNVKDTSATYCVEIGQLANDNALGTSRVEYLRYDIGEPEIGTIEGNFVSFSSNESFAITRVDFQNGAIENILDVSLLGTFPYDSDLSSAIDAQLSQIVQINGVCTPIPSTVTLNEDLHYYTINNYIATIQYDFLDSNGNIYKSQTRSVGMNRIHVDLNQLDINDRLRDGISTKDSSSTSVLEFRHHCIFDVTGVNLLQITAYDANGQKLDYTKLLAFNIA